ncbi:Uncharacterized protein Zm00014a_001230 [Zea mays]|uniref:Nucleic acid-binding OB-fold-like protein n=2 Tax=Zea mays TaxID=4577 RepID=B4FT80_MAIZE|nr:OB-fold nucleic acid binding domain containing protein [Zea mays]ACF85323.1 unknown [Zea mays]ACG35851.1 OB-fold nucleic acid binding domain containing protein [Zea mays]AQL02807.1 Nucleic acid-binding OB-fold-like protein [Zea mays]PWZ05784.1 Uncharacterized protein Zm00014a_001230 [Zea mays]|eukprot:NP_001149564.1 OB-fold nucleic acid binding domain containing protein [Zea mays]
MSTAPRRPFRGRGAPPPGTGYVRRGPAPAPGPADGAKTLRKPVFTTVDQLRPQTHGHTLTARVISARTVLDKPSTHIGRTRVAECLVGDSTGTVLVTARNEQVDLLKPDTTVIFRNAKIDMFKGTMRLVVDKWGRIEVTQPADFKVNQDNNMSLVEYELVDVDEEE